MYDQPTLKTPQHHGTRQITHSTLQVISPGLLKDYWMEGESSRLLPGTFLIIYMQSYKWHLDAMLFVGVGGWHITCLSTLTHYAVQITSVISTCSVAWAEGDIRRDRFIASWIDGLDMYLICKSNIDCNYLLAGLSTSKTTSVQNLRTAQTGILFPPTSLQEPTGDYYVRLHL